jgi:mono/diheme cytochrome c family protein
MEIWFDVGRFCAAGGVQVRISCSTIWRLSITTALLCHPAVAKAQQARQDTLKKGAQIYAASCTAYCHGDGGSAGPGGPRLAGRDLEPDYVEKVIMYGVEGTAMRGWGQTLPVDDVANVIAYVQSLNSPAPLTDAAPLPALDPKAVQGRDLFYDSDGLLMRCSNCHQVNGKGIPVTASIVTVPANVSDLRNLATPQVMNAVAGKQAFPALLSTENHGEMKVYDLTTVPPVLRTFTSAEIKLSNSSSWSHSSVLKAYTDGDLDAILFFLRSVRQPPSGQANSR